MSFAYVFPTDQEVEVLELDASQPFTLSKLQELVGGYIEILHLHNVCFAYGDINIEAKDAIMVLNEEGKIRNLDYNMAGTVLMRANGIADFAVGPVIVCSSELIR